MLALPLIEKAATDSGFDCTPQVLSATAWVFRSSQSTVQVWVTVTATGCTFGLNDAEITLALSTFLAQTPRPAKSPWQGVFFLPAAADLYENLHRAFRQIYRLIQIKATDTITQTEAQGLVKQRRQQGLFRAQLMTYWGGRCAVTGLEGAAFLRASHLKPWAACPSDAERLDVYNGLLLSPTWDVLVDGGWVSFEATGAVRVSARLSAAQRTQLGITGTEKIALTPAHEPYMAYHRTKVFNQVDKK